MGRVIVCNRGVLYFVEDLGMPLENPCTCNLFNAKIN
jgi:hypothetical protein